MIEAVWLVTTEVIEMKSKIINGVWHPLLFGMYSILALYASNLGEIQFQSILRPLVLVFIFSLLLLGIFQVFFKNWARSGLLATWSLLIFLTYGHVYNLARSLDWASFLARHRVLLPIWALLFLGVFILLIKKVREVEKLTQVLNVVMGALLLFTLITLGRHALAQRIARRSYQPSEVPGAAGFTLPKDPPDI